MQCGWGFVTTFSQWSKVDTRWYLGVQCQKCHGTILFALDRSEGTGEGASPLAGKLVLTCTTDKCRHRADYTAASVSRFRKPANSNKIEKGSESTKVKKREH